MLALIGLNEIAPAIIWLNAYWIADAEKIAAIIKSA